MERLLDIEITDYGTVIEEVELTRTMPGFSRRLLVHHVGERLYQSVEVFL